MTSLGRFSRAAKQNFPGFGTTICRAHAHAGTRARHSIGTIVGLLGIIVAAFKTNPWIALGGVLAAYLLAWADHFLIEKMEGVNAPVEACK